MYVLALPHHTLGFSSHQHKQRANETFPSVLGKFSWLFIAQERIWEKICWKSFASLSFTFTVDSISSKLSFNCSRHLFRVAEIKILDNFSEGLNRAWRSKSIGWEIFSCTFQLGWKRDNFLLDKENWFSFLVTAAAISLPRCASLVHLLP